MSNKISQTKFGGISTEDLSLYRLFSKDLRLKCNKFKEYNEENITINKERKVVQDLVRSRKEQ